MPTIKDKRAAAAESGPGSKVEKTVSTVDAPTGSRNETGYDPSRRAEARLGAKRLPGGQWEFVLWAPQVRHASIHILGSKEQIIDMEHEDRGYHFAVTEPLPTGTRYFYRLDETGEDARELPDPASRFQPEGVHGPSQLVDLNAFTWTDEGWNGMPLDRSIIYELHVGTFTPEGTFDAVISRLPELAALGITTIEIMPVAQFPGGRNWGYDGVFPFAPQNTYGGPAGLQRLVNAAHAAGLAVALDVVYNHLGPEGNYLGAYAPYFTDRYRTPWGQAINFDGAGSDEVRRFFLENALYWLENYHFDALRLDAVHGIFDFSALPFLAELKSSVADLSRRLGRPIHLIAESDLNDSRVILPGERGGYGMDAQWSDDFHQSVHTLLTGETKGYYRDFGRVSHLARTLRDGWCYSGQYSEFRQRRHGNSPHGLSPSHFVVCNQNHDQVGNRAAGERLSALVDFERLKLAAGVTLLSPFVPLLFMGEEYGETAPFQFFTSFLDENLVEAVRRGRQSEFASFGWEERIPDPQDDATFRRSQLRHDLKTKEPHATLLRFYQELTQLRNERDLGTGGQWRVWEYGISILLLFRESSAGRFATIFSFADSITTVELPGWQGSWKLRISSADHAWRGPGESLPVELTLSKPYRLQLHPYSFVAFEELPSTSEPV
jgi:maltooligosyltrehalose trehalohydrolase